MNAARFARALHLIEHRSPGRTHDWRKRATAKLVAQVHAEPLRTGSRVLSYRLPDGCHVCVKHRYATEPHAISAIVQIGLEADGRRKPIRAYACSFCCGWHITSRK
jgi:hypothetical protein